ncbi:MAG TPA: hypothetical protein PLB52_02490 [Candidatus Moranbacteria bacterium]|nr:hypothetical protein [Candidatus Moranbacteria bacterium]
MSNVLSLFGETTVPAETLEIMIRKLTNNQKSVTGFPQTKLGKFKSAIKQIKIIMRQKKIGSDDAYSIPKRQLAFLNRLASVMPNYRW